MKHLIMGTAGHIDHGKTALIKALTHIDCDTHKEEKKRGITINLGFAHMNLPSGDSIGIIDVPGHKDFVHTMVGGASGIDFVLMVIAADSGVMPQTREHLQIMEILGVKHGLVALSKTDLAEDPEILKLSREDIREFVAGTFLQSSPIIEISAKTGAGLETLKEKISEIVSQIEGKFSKGIFRLYIDRVFSVSGFGTVVNGSVMGGGLKVKDTVYHLPGKKKALSVRRLERHGKEVSEVFAGDRASMNIAGLDKADLSKGDLISDRYLNTTNMFDAQLKLFEGCRSLKIWSQVIFHTGTFENKAKIHLIDRNQLRAEETALVQIHLSNPCVLRHGDRFVIRASSSDTTLGGGEVIDVAPLHHRRRPEKLIKNMSYIADGQLPKLISSEVKKSQGAIFADEVAFKLNISASEVEDNLDQKNQKDILKYDIKGKIILILKERLQLLRQGINHNIKEFLRLNPLIERGISLNELLGGLKIDQGGAGEEVIKIILQEQTLKGKLVEKDKSWKISGEYHSADKRMESLLKFFDEYLKGFGMKTPLMSQLIDEAEKRHLSKRELKQILYHLASTGKVYKTGDDYIHASLVNSCREKLIKKLSGQSQGITVAGFRDLVNGNRKICLLLLALFDSEKTTRREGDLRFLIEGKQ